MKALQVFKMTILFTVVALLYSNTVKSQTYGELDALYKKTVDENYSSFDIYLERYKVVLQKAKESKNEELTAVNDQELNKIFKTRSDMMSLKNVVNKLYDTMNVANN